MSQSNIRHEPDKETIEPLLPIEKKLIAWSLGTGAALLAALALISHFVPAVS